MPSSAATPPPPSFNFTQIQGVVAVWQAEDLSAAGDGNPVTANWVDRKNGYILAPLSGDMGTYRANAFRNGAVTAGLEQVGKAAKCIDAALMATFAGTNKSYTIITLAQLMPAYSTSYYWGLGENANFFKNINFLFGGASQGKNGINTNSGTPDYATEFQCIAPQMLRTQRVGPAYTLYKDEIAEASFSHSDGGINAQHFGVGLDSVGSSTLATSAHQISAIIVVDTNALPGNVMTVSDVNSSKALVASRLGLLKKGLGTTPWTSTKVMWTAQAQSNASFEGRATTTPYIALTAPKAYSFRLDSYLVPGNDPSGDDTNNKFFSHAGATGSNVPTMLNSLFASGVFNGTTQACVISGWSLSGTKAAGWKANSNPPSVINWLDISYLRMIETMRNMPNPTILCHMIDQGEDNSLNPTDAAAWSGDTTAICNTVEAMATAQGWAWEKTNLRHYVQALSNQQAALWSDGATVRAAQLAFPGTRSANNTIARAAPDGLPLTVTNHFDTAAWGNPAFIPAMMSDIAGAS